MPEFAQINFPLPMKAVLSSLNDSSKTKMILSPCTDSGGTRRTTLAKMSNSKTTEVKQDHSYFNQLNIT